MRWFRPFDGGWRVLGRTGLRCRPCARGKWGICSVAWLLFLATALTGCGGGASSNNGSSREAVVNQSPVFASPVDISVPENTLTLPAVKAVDADGDRMTYSIVGGDDADRFHLDSQTGELSFHTAPDFDAPIDSNANNTYLVTVAASDGVDTVRQLLVVTVLDGGLTITVAPDHIKTLTFDWALVPGASYYRLFVNPDNMSGYTQVGEDIVATRVEVTIPVHLTDWANSRYLLEGYDELGRVSRSDVEGVTPLMLDAIGYIKASNADSGDSFGRRVALSADGTTLAVGARHEGSGAMGIDGDQGDNSTPDAGAAYVFVREGPQWVQQAYLKASNTEAGDWFGDTVALSADGSTLAVGAWSESSGAAGVDAEQQDNTLSTAGAVYVFRRDGGTWAQQAYIKAPNPGEYDGFGGFGESLALSDDGNTLAVGAWGEDSAARGIDGDHFDNSADDAGAAYVFTRSGTTWTQHAYIKASNAEVGDAFGVSVALSGDGNTLAVGAQGESSASTRVDGDQDNNDAVFAGAVYVFTRTEGRWAQQAYIKASNADFVDKFGERLVLSGDGRTLAVGAMAEASAAVGIDGDQDDNSAFFSGAVYVFGYEDGEWVEQAYIKASNAELADVFGRSLALSGDGNILAVGAEGEDSAAMGIGGEQHDNDAEDAGAVYVFERREDVWAQRRYIKAPNTGAGDQFGFSVALSADGKSLAVGAWDEDSAARGVGGDRDNNSALTVGAVYLY